MLSIAISLSLTARQGAGLPPPPPTPFQPTLKFNDRRDSQYLPLIFVLTRR